MSYRDGIHHIVLPDNPRKAYCGRTLLLGAFHIQNLTHAEACIEQGCLVQPCKLCLRKARAADPYRTEPEVRAVDVCGTGGSSEYPLTQGSLLLVLDEFQKKWPCERCDKQKPDCTCHPRGEN